MSGLLGGCVRYHGGMGNERALGVGKLAAGAFVFSQLTRGFSAMRTSMEEMLQTNNNLMMAMTRFKGAVRAMIEPIYSGVVPALTAMLNLLTRVVTALGTFTATIFGKTAAEALQRMFDNPSALPPIAKVKPLRLVERESTRTYPLSPKWLSDALVFIQSNLSQGISAMDVYAHVGKSHTLVDAAFRSQLGTSVQKEISRIRLKESRRLVMSTATPLQDIARHCGFSSLQYFSTTFARAFGTSPSSLRPGSRH